MTKKVLLAAAVLLVAVLLAAATDHDYRPQYTKDGQLIFPADYRQWQFVSSGLGMSYSASRPGAPRAPGFSNIFVQPWAYRTFKASGKWPDKTIFILEAYRSGTHASINKQGYFQDSFNGIEAEVKDSEHSPDVWSYYNLGSNPTSAAALPKNACWECHDKNAAVEHSFTQFYPELLDVALQKKTVKEGIYIAPSLNRLRDLIVTKGWGEGERALEEAKRHDAEASILDEASLNALGYQLIAAKRGGDAVKVMERATREHPDSLNAMDSLADALVVAGEKERALEVSQTILKKVEGEHTALGDALAKASKERMAVLSASQP